VWNLLDAQKPPLAELLGHAAFIEHDDDVGIGRLEICRRVVEGEVTVLSNADVFVEVKRRNPVPVDPRCTHQGLECCELACAGCQDDSRVPLEPDRRTDTLDAGPPRHPR
jgi:hypothetical protein